MNPVNSIESTLVEYLRADHAAWGPINAETDLIESGWLDSLAVMDLVCFIKSRFGIGMMPCDISPLNLRNVRCMTRYISERLPRSANVA